MGRANKANTKETMTYDAQETKFTDPRNIESPARVIWAAETTTLDGIKHPEGWVLPGGRRTTNQFEAMAMAARMAEMVQAMGAK
jgi:hypothetical protein